MNTEYDVLTVLDTCVDLILAGQDVTPEFGQKEKWFDDYTIEMGGSGCIFASQAAKLGLRAAGAGYIGNDAFGNIVMSELKNSCVDTIHVTVDPAAKTGLGVLLCQPSDRAILTYNGTIDKVSAIDITDNLLCGIRHLHIGSYYLLNGMRPFWLSVAKRAKDFGATISLDTNWDPLNEWGDDVIRLLEFVDIFMPNEQEAMMLSHLETLNEALSFFAGKVPILAVKRGEKGALAISGGRLFEHAAPEVNVIDTVGAGDSFDAGFIWGYLKGFSIEDCLKAGCYCGSMSTRGRGGSRAQAYEKDLLDHMQREEGDDKKGNGN